MPVHVEKYPNEPIIVATFHNPMDYGSDVAAMFNRILQLRDTIQNSSKYYVVIDMTGMTPGFSDILQGLGETRKVSRQRRADLTPSIHLVGSGQLFEMVAGALSQHQYGGYSAPLYTTKDAALEAVYKELRSGAEAQ